MNYRFSGHQTFVFRYGWLEKGVDLVRSNPKGFLADDSIVKLGVGKNMVESIKYWCQQTGLIMDSSVRQGEQELTDFAKFIFGEEPKSGVDPYLEDDASLWLLHYNLTAQAPESTWSTVFNSWNKPEFTKAELLHFMQRRLSGKCVVSDKSLERDIDCFVRSYIGTKSKNVEDGFDCPFLELSLIQATDVKDLYRLNICHKQNLPLPVIGYAVLMRLKEMNSTSSSVQNMLFERHSPGQIFKLDENTLIGSVMELEKLSGGMINYTETAGIANINFRSRNTIDTEAKNLLRGYYGRVQ